MDEANYTRTVSELAEKFDVKTNQILYYVKKHLDELGDHVYKKPGPTTPYKFDDTGFRFMTTILSQAFSSPERNDLKAGEHIEILKSSYALIIKNYEERLIELERSFDARLEEREKTFNSQLEEQKKNLNFRLEEQKKNYETQLNEQKRSSNELLKVKDDLILQLNSNVEQLSKTLDQQQQLAAISMKNFEIEQNKSQKHGFFSRFRNKKGE